jgi:hypothetical protein
MMLLAERPHGQNTLQYLVLTWSRLGVCASIADS